MEIICLTQLLFCIKFDVFFTKKYIFFEKENVIFTHMKGKKLKKNHD